MSGLYEKGICLAICTSDEVQVLDSFLFIRLSQFLAKVATKLFDTDFFFKFFIFLGKQMEKIDSTTVENLCSTSQYHILPYWTSRISHM